MSADHTFSTSDLRSSAQDYKRDAARKHKWAFGEQETAGRGPGNPRPRRTSENPFYADRRYTMERNSHSARKTRKHNAAANGDIDGLGLAVSDEDSSGAASSSDDAHFSDVPAVSATAAAAAPSAASEAAIMYSFDAPRGPSQGSQILNVALAKAMQRFEEKETVKLVRSEYDVLDSEGGSVGYKKKVGKSKGKKAVGFDGAVVDEKVSGAGDEDEEYEFV